MDNYHNVLLQMEQFGIELRDKDRDAIQALPGSTHEGRRKTCGKAGKDWFKFYVWRPDRGGQFITGSFGTYRHGGSWQKVELDMQPLGDEERERQKRERDAAKQRAEAIREEERAVAAMDAVQLWRRASPTGRSPYLERKGLQGESCRYLADGTLVLPLLRYDLPRSEALQAAQRVLPNGRKLYTKGFSKPGCALRLGELHDDVALLLVVEGYATGLTVRMATGHRLPVYVALDAGNLVHVVALLRELFVALRILICADDDWKTVDPETQALTNPGRTSAKAAARATPGCDIVWPVFTSPRRGPKHTDFDDLRQLQGIDAVERQLQGAIAAMEKFHG